MAEKNEPFIAYATEKEWEEHFRMTFDAGVEQGFEDGVAHALSFVLSILDNFNDDVRHKAEFILKNRENKKYQQEQIWKKRFAETILQKGHYDDPNEEDSHED